MQSAANGRIEPSLLNFCIAAEVWFREIGKFNADTLGPLPSFTAGKSNDRSQPFAAFVPPTVQTYGQLTVLHDTAHFNGSRRALSPISRSLSCESVHVEAVQ